mgnify:CR=1 FL=1
MRLILLTLLLASLLFMSSCSSPSTPVVYEAPDYSPVCESLKFLGLCFLGISIICAVASIIKNIIQKSS